MQDFEVHPIGTAIELKLSRELAREIEQITQQYGGVVPQNVLNVYFKLKNHYAVQLETELL